jgi:hypothetical protein
VTTKMIANQAMTVSVWHVLRALGGVESGRWCRGCGESIERDDRFGRSEAVCRSCRHAMNA